MPRQSIRHTEDYLTARFANPVTGLVSPSLHTLSTVTTPANLNSPSPLRTPRTPGEALAIAALARARGIPLDHPHGAATYTLGYPELQRRGWKRPFLKRREGEPVVPTIEEEWGNREKTVKPGRREYLDEAGGKVGRRPWEAQWITGGIPATEIARRAVREAAVRSPSSPAQRPRSDTADSSGSGSSLGCRSWSTADISKAELRNQQSGDTLGTSASQPQIRRKAVGSPVNGRRTSLDSQDSQTTNTNSAASSITGHRSLRSVAGQTIRSLADLPPVRFVHPRHAADVKASDACDQSAAIVKQGHFVHSQLDDEKWRSFLQQAARVVMYITDHLVSGSSAIFRATISVHWRSVTDDSLSPDVRWTNFRSILQAIFRMMVAAYILTWGWQILSLLAKGIEAFVSPVGFLLRVLKWFLLP